MLSCKCTCVENVDICESENRCFHICPCCNIQLCWSFDAANNFFGVVPLINVEKKERKIGSQLKVVQRMYLLMWCGTQPTPTRQYVSLLWWWARKCPHPPTDWKVCVPSIVTLWIFQYCWQCKKRGLPPCLKWQKNKPKKSILWLLFTRTNSKLTTSVTSTTPNTHTLLSWVCGL